MTEQEIIEGNKLIAEFMDGQIGMYANTNNEYYRHLRNGCSYLVIDLNYHKSWDWLIPVVKNCRRIRNEAKGVGHYQWQLELLYDQITVFVLALDITTVWLSCETFIKHYNSRQP